MNFEISLLTGKDTKSWDEFVIANNNSTFYHQTGWEKVIETTYGHKPYYLLAKNEIGELIGILPMFMLKNRVLGRQLISIPFAPYGGACCENDYVRSALIDEAINIGDHLNVNDCEFRDNVNKEYATGYKKIDLYSTFHLDISQGTAAIWERIDRKTRNMVRKGEKNGLKFEIEFGSNAIKEFYDLYAINMKNLGTPVHSAKFFLNIYRNFPSSVYIARVKLHTDIISSLYLIKFKNILISGWGASQISYRKYAPNDFIYWNCIKYALENNNLSLFDFGRSLKGTGTYKFKNHWNCTEIPLNYWHFSSRNILTHHDTYSKFATAWQRLPLKLTRLIGPRIRGYIP